MALNAVASSFQSDVFQNSVWVSTFWTIIGLVWLGAPVGVFQWLLLKRHIHQAHWWIVARAISGSVIFPITGFALVWLVHTSRLAEKRKMLISAEAELMT